MNAPTPTVFATGLVDVDARCGITSEPVIDTGLSHLRLGSDGIVYLQYHPGSDENIENIHRYFPEMERLASKQGGKGLRVLVDMSNVKQVESEAREFYSSEETAKTVAKVAFIVANPLARALITIFLKLNAPPLQLQLFKDYEDAREWLRAV